MVTIFTRLHDILMMWSIFMEESLILNVAKNNFGGVLKSMLASDVAIIDIEEHQIEYLKVIIKLFREAAGFSNGST